VPWRDHRCRRCIACASGLLRISLVAVPVKAYSAVSSTASAPHFHLLHAGCGQRIGYQKHCPRHGPVPAEAIERGYEYAPDQHVVVEAEELDKLRPTRDKALVLEQFVGLDEVDPVFFSGRSLYLLPDGAAAQHPYAVLVDALRQSAKAALGRVVLSGSRQLVLVRPAGKLLAMDVLHYPAQVRQASAWGKTGRRTLEELTNSKREMQEDPNRRYFDFRIVHITTVPASNQ
jgi:DNA end-binding protein Ku